MNLKFPSLASSILVLLLMVPSNLMFPHWEWTPSRALRPYLMTSDTISRTRKEEATLGSLRSTVINPTVNVRLRT
ncbi:unnamed protein product [Linum trigynum]|uniref:Secreted protein n=1 Tax=Linum trigynum TaxID=586398 RepID=A0AAV2GQB6_9ROSI